jgi:peptidoglycan/xylan/chitin deacetylase (PgdA/CDA1 family)
MKKLATALLIFSLTLTACSGKPDTAEPPAQTPATATPSVAASPASPSAAEPPVVAPPAAASQVVPQQTSQPSPGSNDDANKFAPAEAGKAANNSPAPKEAEIPKTYHMNKNYFIVPNDPEGNKKVVLLTFDDGPKEKEMIEPMLKTLDKHNAKAIFFVNGYRIKAHPELLKMIADAGQIIGNHSWDHIELKKQTNEKIKDQITRNTEIIEKVTGKKPEFFRPPYASSNDYVRQVVKEQGMLFMTWSNGSLDWDMAKTPEEDRPAAIIKNVFDQLHPGSNILMHELPWTVKTLDDLLTKLEENGYSFVDPRAIELEAR